LSNCINLPDATETAAFPIRAQHRHGESNPEHFSVKMGIAQGPVGTLWQAGHPVQRRPRGPSVLFRHILKAKLMHKIHRLTDN
jgi:hypothetical protein